MRAKRASLTRPSPVSLSVFSLVPDILFDCSRVLQYAKIRTVLQSREGWEEGREGRKSMRKAIPFHSVSDRGIPFSYYLSDLV